MHTTGNVGIDEAMFDYKFLKAFFKNWKEVGALAPTSRFVARRMLKNIDFNGAKVIVELGAGMGRPITREILRRMGPDARLMAFEINPEFCAELERMGDARLIVINDSAANLERRLGGIVPDHVVSSIPLSTLRDDVRDDVLRQIKEALRPGGSFVQVQYSWSSNGAIRSYFNDVRRGIESLNLPPAIIYECRP